MKYFAAFLLTAVASTAAAADYMNDQGARLLIGQRVFTAQDSGASELLLGAAGGVAYAADMLFVADANRLGATPQNRRILVYKNISQKFPSPTASLDVGPRCNVCTADATTPKAADVVLGQPDFSKTDVAATQTGMRLPTAVASDGKVIAVADTENNRILIWLNIPTANGAPADVVLGQDDFTTVRQPVVVDAKSFRSPQGVWIQNGRLYVADSQNDRVLIWNSIPTQNNVAADLVLGQPDFSTTSEADLAKATLNTQANSLLSPTSVSSDGVRLYVADLGHNRVLIWNDVNSLTTQKPADVVLGQPDMTTAIANNSSALCSPNGTDSTTGNPTYPARCSTTLNFPRFALSDGQRLYVADGGNDRVLIWSQIPNVNAFPPDTVLGQPDMTSDVITDAEDFFTPNLQRGSADTVRTPNALAWDGTNLYVADPFDRRVIAFTPAQTAVPPTGVRNAASLAKFAVGNIQFGGTPTAGENVKITIGQNDPNGGTTPINTHDYTYQVIKDDTLTQIIRGLVAAINAGSGDPFVLARANVVAGGIQLTSRLPGDSGSNIVAGYTLDTASTLTVSITNPTGGKNAVEIAPGSLITLLGTRLCDCDPTYVSEITMPRQLAGVQLYIDGVPAPLKYVSKTQINAQMPFEVSDATSVSAYVRYKTSSGDVVVTNAVNVPIALQNPAIFAQDGDNPRPAVAFHAFVNATAVVSVDGTITAGDVGTITIEDRNYAYTVTATDTLETVRNALVDLINANAAEKVYALRSGAFTRVIIQAKAAGSEGNGIPVTTTVSSGATLLLTALNAQTCCASNGQSQITATNPAVAGETIIIYATGLGLVQPDEAKNGAQTGVGYFGPVLNQPNSFVSALAGGKTANVLASGLKPNAVGLYEIWLQLNSSLPTDPLTQVTIAQDIYVSNIVTIPVVASQ